MLKLTDKQALALTKFKLPGGARSNVLPGNYAGSMILRIDYDVTVGKDYESTVSAAVPWKDLATYLLGKVNAATRDKVLREALVAVTAGPASINGDALETKAVEAVREIMSATKKKCAGKVTGSCNALVVSADAVAA